MVVRRFSVVAGLALFLVLAGLGSVRPAWAQSQGCRSLNGLALDNSEFAGIGGPGMIFEAGDRITLVVANPSVAATARLTVGGVEVDSAPLGTGQSVTLEYTFSAGGQADVFGNSGIAKSTFVFTCVGKALPTPAPAADQPGPSIPSGFVLRTITCDTPLFTTPDGSPVPGGAAVTTGQTWFLAPEADPETPKWIEGFFGGTTNAWLRAACVA